MKKVSVVIPVYNVEEYLPQCLESVISQSYKELEILVVASPCTDRTVEIAQSYACKDERVKVLLTDGKLVAARKMGLTNATGDYISHIDSDDWLDPEMYTKMVKKMEESDSDAVCCDYYNVYENKKSEVGKEQIPEGVLSSIDKKSIISYLCDEETGARILNWNTWVYLFKKDRLYDLQMAIPDTVFLGEDMAIVWPYLCNASRLYVLREPLYYHRLRSGSGSLEIGRDRVDRLLDLYMYLKEQLVDHENFEQINYALRMNLFDASVAAMHGFFFGEMLNFYYFPYSRVPKGKKVVLYGAGMVGKSYYQQIQANRYCELVLWVDRNYQKIADLEVSAPATLKETEFDHVLIALRERSVIEEIKEELVRDYKIPEDKIIMGEPYMLSKYYC